MPTTSVALTGEVAADGHHAAQAGEHGAAADLRCLVACSTTGEISEENRAA